MTTRSRPTIRRMLALVAGIAVVLGAYESGRRSAVPATTVYLSRTGSRYHRGSCRYLGGAGIAVPLPLARDGRYRPCRACGPPTR